MADIKTFRQLALSFTEAIEVPHFDKPSFRVRKKIFATLDMAGHKAVLKFSETDQSAFCSFDKTIIYPVPGTWGKQGWTIVELQKIRMNMLKDALTTSYCTVAPKKLALEYLKQK